MTVLEVTMLEHIKLCDRRGQVLSRIAWFTASGVLALLGLLLQHIP